MGKKGAEKFADAGFTLTELMVVVVMIGVLSAIAYPYIGNERGNAEARDFASEVARSLQVARSRAVSERLTMRAYVYRDRVELRAWQPGATPAAPATPPNLAEAPFRSVMARTGTEVLDVRPNTSTPPVGPVLSTTLCKMLDFNSQGRMEFSGNAPNSAFIYIRNAALPVGVPNRDFRVDARAITGHVALITGWN